jgi:asparaginyl-tRNA synthetase
MQRRRIRELFASPPLGEELVIEGWLRTRRDSKAGMSFLEVSDGSSQRNLQVIAPAELPEYAGTVLALGTGAAVRVRGRLQESPAAGQPVELLALEVTQVGPAGSTYPLQKKRHSFEYLRTIAHLRPRTNTFGAIGRVRHVLARAIHDYMDDNGFYYLHTPIITTSDAEGAGEAFTVTTLDPATAPKAKGGGADWSQDFFARRAFLTVSGQLEAEAWALALGRVYTFGPTFRAENSNTARHLAEFWMIEPEMAFADLDVNAEVAEGLLKHCLRALFDRCEDELRFFEQFMEPGLMASLEHVIATPFERLSYTEGVRILEKSGRSFEYPVSWGAPLQTEHERYLAEDHLKKPLVLTDYPASFSAFYMRLNEDGRTVRNMDVLVPRVGEIVGGSQREERFDVLRDRIHAAGLDPALYDWYLDLRRWGSAPHAGFGLGFERLLLFATGMKNIRDVIPFPRTPGHADF